MVSIQSTSVEQETSVLWQSDKNWGCHSTQLWRNSSGELRSVHNGRACWIVHGFNENWEWHAAQTLLCLFYRYWGIICYYLLSNSIPAQPVCSWICICRKKHCILSFKLLLKHASLRWLNINEKDVWEPWEERLPQVRLAIRNFRNFPSSHFIMLSLS